MKTFILLFITFCSFSLFALTDSCQKTCTLNADCGTGGVCKVGICALKAHFCVNDRWSANERGEYQDCAGYNCNDKTGLCKTESVDSGDCSAGFVHDGKGSCVKSIKCDTAEPSCQDLMNKWQATRKNWEQLNPAPSLPVYSCMTCENHEQCKGDTEQMCWNKRCVLSSHYCEKSVTGEEISKNKSGLEKSCGEYTCDAVLGECRNFCVNDSQCLSGFVCSADRRCVSTFR